MSHKIGGGLTIGGSLKNSADDFTSFDYVFSVFSSTYFADSSQTTSFIESTCIFLQSEDTFERHFGLLALLPIAEFIARGIDSILLRETLYDSLSECASVDERPENQDLALILLGQLLPLFSSRDPPPVEQGWNIVIDRIKSLDLQEACRQAEQKFMGHEFSRSNSMRDSLNALRQPSVQDLRSGGRSRWEVSEVGANGSESEEEEGEEKERKQPARSRWTVHIDGEDDQADTMTFEESGEGTQMVTQDMTGAESASDGEDEAEELETVESHFIDGKLYERLLFLLRGMGPFLGAAQSHDEEQARVVDRFIFSCLELKTCVPLLCEAVQVLYAYFPNTYNARSRVRVFIQCVMDDLVGLYDRADRPELFFHIDRLFSVWYPRVTDEFISNCKARELLTGYAKHRLGDMRRDKLDNATRDASWMIEEKQMVEREDSTVSLATSVVDSEYGTATYIPAQHSLTMRLADKELLFTGSSQFQAVDIYNTMTVPSQFYIQTHPSDCFVATPSFGVVPAKGKAKIVLSYIAGITDPKERSGYLRIRNKDGFSLERVPLRGHNASLFSVLLSEMDCGFCPVGERRLFPVPVYNSGLAPVECYVLTTTDDKAMDEGDEGITSEAQLAREAARGVKTRSNQRLERMSATASTRDLLRYAPSRAKLLRAIRKSTWRVYPTRFRVPPNSFFYISVAFAPTRVGSYESAISIHTVSTKFAGAGQEHVYTIKTLGRAGQSLRVCDRSIDFGPTFPSPTARYTATLQLASRELKTFLPVRIRSASQSLIVDDLQLPPGSVFKQPVAFLPRRAQTFSETITVMAPNSTPRSVTVTSQVGAVVVIPVAVTTILPPRSVGGQSSLVLPLINASKFTAKFTVDPLVGTPFSWVIRIPSEGLNTSDLVYDARSYTKTECPTISLGPGKEGTMEMQFRGIVSGFYRVSPAIHISEPYVTTYDSYSFVGYCLPSAPLSVVELRSAKNFLSDAGNKEVVDLKTHPLPFDTRTGKAETASVVSVTPRTLHLFKRSKVSTNVNASVSIKNLTSGTVILNILPSSPFSVVGVSEIRLNAEASTSVTLGFAPRAPGYDSTETLYGTMYLQVAGRLSETSVVLVGCNSFPVVPSFSHPIFALPESYIEEEVAREFHFSNITPQAYAWELRSPLTAEAAEHPISISPMRGILKPHGTGSARFSLQAAGKGSFSRAFNLVVSAMKNEGERGGRAQLKTTGDVVEVYSGHALGSAGEPELHFEPNKLVFDRGTNLMETRTMKVRLANRLSREITALLVIRSHADVFQVGSDNITLNGYTTLDVAVKFTPTSAGVFVSYLEIHYGSSLKAILLVGFGGFFSIISSLGSPYQLGVELPSRDGGEEGATTHRRTVGKNIDVGAIAVGRKRDEVVTFTNTSPFELTIVDVRTSPLLEYTLIPNEVACVDYGRLDASTKESLLDFDELETLQTIFTEQEARRVLATLPVALPLTLGPQETLRMRLSFDAEEVGEVMYWLEMRSVGMEFPCLVRFQFTLAVQLPPSLHPQLVEYLGVSAGASESRLVKLNNPGRTSLSWQFVPKQTAAGATEPFVVFPTRGLVQPESSSSIEVVFKPLVAPDTLGRRLAFVTDLGRLKLLVQAEACGAQLELSRNKIDFGCIRVGAMRSTTLVVTNVGTIGTVASVDMPEGGAFTAKPLKANIAAGGSLDLVLSFCPQDRTICKTHVTVTYPLSHVLSKSYNPPSVGLSVQGSGGVPIIDVPRSTIDFGTALLDYKNKYSLKINNNGDATADISFACADPRVSFDPETELTLEGRSKNAVTVFFQPGTFEPLNTYMTIMVDEVNNEERRVMLRGSVGVPTFNFDPPVHTNGVRMGICLINRPHTTTFTITNSGSIDASYTMSFVEADETALRSLRIHPTSGKCRIGQPVTFALVYTPDTVYRQVKVMLLFCSPHRDFLIPVVGTGGSPLFGYEDFRQSINFGTCRIGTAFNETVLIRNTGNMRLTYRCEITDLTDPAASAEAAAKHKPAVGAARGASKALPRVFTLDGEAGVVAPEDEVRVRLAFLPYNEDPRRAKLVITHPQGRAEIALTGRGGRPNLTLTDASGKPLGDGVFNFGVSRVHIPTPGLVYLRNTGLLATDFHVGPKLPPEVKVFPTAGTVDPGEIFPLRLSFTPANELIMRSDMRIVWARGVIVSGVVGIGGTGILHAELLHERDMHTRRLNFDLVPVECLVERRFRLSNRGSVGINFNLSVTPEDFECGFVPPTITKLTRSLVLAQNRSASVDGSLDPGKSVVAFVVLNPDKEREYNGTIVIKSRFNTIKLPMFAKAGSLSISHEGNLHFGELATNHVYSRKIILHNKGSFGSDIFLSLLMPGQTAGTSWRSTVLLDKDKRLSARARWQKAISEVIKQLKEPPKPRKTAKERWAQLRTMVLAAGAFGGSLRREEAGAENGAAAGGDTSQPGEAAAAARKTMMDELMRKGMELQTNVRMVAARVQKVDSYEDLLESKTSDTKLPTLSSSDSRGLTTRSMTQTSQFQLGKKAEFRALATAARAKDRFLAAVRSRQITGTEISPEDAYLKVEPVMVSILPDGSQTITVELKAGRAEHIAATLLVRATLPGYPLYEIPLSAKPRAMAVAVDNNSTLNFGRLPIGESGAEKRVFSNNGPMKLKYRIRNKNFGLTVSPQEGMLDSGQSVTVDFVFRPLSDAVQNRPVVFDTDAGVDCALNMWGAGGFARLKLSSYRRFDFGRCMIGKSTPQVIKLGNEGNASLSITSITIDAPGGAFEPGKGWPKFPLLIRPGREFPLSIFFNPASEDPCTGKLTISTFLRSHQLELNGSGREAMLLVEPLKLRFENCFVGNSYEKSFTVTNAGDVNYPLRFVYSKDRDDLFQYGDAERSDTELGDLTIESDDGKEDAVPEITFVPSKLTLNSFEKKLVIVRLSPQRPSEESYVLKVLSPYSQHEIMCSTKSDSADIILEPEDVDFGVFTPSSHIPMTVKLHNPGTRAISFRLHIRPKVAQILKFGVSRGIVGAGDTMEMQVSYRSTEQNVFEEVVALETEIVGRIKSMRITGKCAVPTINTEHLKPVRFGSCLVGEQAHKQLVIENIGLFTLHYAMRVPYPLHASQTQGDVEGKGKVVVPITWTPSGQYELRSTIQVTTDDPEMGARNVTVYGTSWYPRFSVNPLSMDFGAGAVGLEYTRKIHLRNTGPVAVTWKSSVWREEDVSGTGTKFSAKRRGQAKASMDKVSILSMRGSQGRLSGEVDFTLDPANGVVAKGARGTLNLRFKPLAVRESRCVVRLESSGVLKEVLVAGFGGECKLEFDPPFMDLGEVPCNQVHHYNLTLRNTGQVPLNLEPRLDPTLVRRYRRLRASLQENGKSVLVSAGASRGITLTLLCSEKTSFEFPIVFSCKEGTWETLVSGEGTFIRLSQASRAVLDAERLGSLEAPEPFHVNDDSTTKAPGPEAITGLLCDYRPLIETVTHRGITRAQEPATRDVGVPEYVMFPDPLANGERG